MCDNKREYGINSLQNLGELDRIVVVGLDPCHARRNIAERGILRMMIRGWIDDTALTGLGATSQSQPFEIRARCRASCWQRGRQAPLGQHLRELSAVIQKLCFEDMGSLPEPPATAIFTILSQRGSRKIKERFGCDPMFNNWEFL